MSTTARIQKGRQRALVETEPLELDVTSELGDNTPSLANLEPMVPPQPVPPTLAIGWIVACGLLPLIAILVIVALRRRSAGLSSRGVRPLRKSRRRGALAVTRREPAGRGLVKEFYLRLTGIVRQYVEDTTGIRAPEQTTEEFLRDMRARAVFSPERSARLAEFLEAADLVKYAGQQPEHAQLEQAIARRTNL